MSDYALPRLRTRRRKPWSGWTRVMFALAVVFLLYTFMDWLEIFAGHRLFRLNHLFDGVGGLDGWDLLQAGLDPVLTIFYWRQFKQSKARDERD